MRVIKILVTALVAALCFATPGHAAGPDKSDPNTLYDKSLRISVTKPDGWRFLTSKEKRASRFAITYKDKSIDMMVKRYSQSVRIVISKYPEPYAGVNPSVSIDLFDLGSERLSDSLRVANLHFTRFRRGLFKKLDHYEPARLVELDGKSFGYYRVRYTLEAEKIPPLESDTRWWFYSLPLAVLQITATGTQSGDDVCQAELDAIIASIRYNPR